MLDWRNAWVRYRDGLAKSDPALQETPEFSAEMAFLSGWSCRGQEDSEADTKIINLTEQVSKLVEFMTPGTPADPIRADQSMQITRLKAAIQYAIDNRQSTFNYETWMDLCRQGGMNV